MFATATATRYVEVDGPFADQDRRSGDEFPYWTVAICDDDGEPVGKIYNCYSHNKAVNLGRNIARDRRLELVNEAGDA